MRSDKPSSQTNEDIENKIKIKYRTHWQKHNSKLLNIEIKMSTS